jgi:hypothetical protein
MCLPNPQFPLIIYKWKGQADPAAATDLTVTAILNNNFSWGTNAVQWENNVNKFRPLAKSTTLYFDTAALYNQGKIFAAQLAVDIKLIDSLSAGYTAGQPVVQAVDTVLPTQGSAIMQMSDKSYSGSAKDGVYLPFSFNDASMIYSFGSCVPTRIISYLGTTGSAQTANTDLGGPYPGKAVPIYPMMNVGWIVLKDLLPQAVFSIKDIHAWEIQTGYNSAWAPFLTPGAPPDSEAVESAFTARYHMEDGYPSAMNDWGSIWQGLKSFAPVLYQAIKPAAKLALGSVPGGALANQAWEMIENEVNRKVPSKSGSKKKVQPSLPQTNQKQSVQPLTKSQRKKLRKKAMETEV